MRYFCEVTYEDWVEQQKKNVHLINYIFNIIKYLKLHVSVYIYEMLDCSISY